MVHYFEVRPFCYYTNYNYFAWITLNSNYILTRSPKQYINTEGALRIDIENVSVEEDLEDFQNCCVVFDDMLDSNQKLIDPIFTRGRHNDLDVHYLSQSYFNLP